MTKKKGGKINLAVSVSFKNQSIFFFNFTAHVEMLAI